MTIANLLLAGVLAANSPGASSAASGVVELRVIAVNDFHGHLEPELYAFDDGAPVLAGGAPALSATLARLRAGTPHSVFVATGDLIGASPLVSSLAHDEPTLAVFRRLGLQADAVGNHELDAGLAVLRRQQALAGFPLLSANLVDASSRKPVFAPYRIVTVEGVSVAFVGATVRNALQPLEPDLVKGVRLDDEVVALNAQAKLLENQGVHALVALLHEGAGAQGARIDAAGCDALAGPARRIAEGLDPAYDLVLSAHTHAVYACRVGSRWLVQGGSNGHYLTVADLHIDRGRADVVQVSVRNEPVLATASVGDAQVLQITMAASHAAAKIADAPVAKLPAPRISASADDEGGSPLGRLVARAQLAAAHKFGAQLACTNPSSVPKDLVASLPGSVASYADLHAVQPYGNRLKVRRASGAQLRELWQQQARDDGVRLDLSCAPKLDFFASSEGGSGVRVGGSFIGENDSVLMVVNSYLARGGQGFSVLSDALEVGDAGNDLDALMAFLRAHAPASGKLPAPALPNPPGMHPDERILRREALDDGGQYVVLARFPVQRVDAVCTSTMRTLEVTAAGKATTLAEGPVAFANADAACRKGPWDAYFDIDEPALPYLAAARGWLRGKPLHVQAMGSCRGLIAEPLDLSGFHWAQVRLDRQLLVVSMDSSAPDAVRLEVRVAAADLANARAFGIADCIPLQPRAN